MNGSQDYPGKPPATITHGGKKVLFLRVDFSDVAYPGWMTEQYLHDQAYHWDGLDPCLRRMSYGKAWIELADVTPVMRNVEDGV